MSRGIGRTIVPERFGSGIGDAKTIRRLALISSQAFSIINFRGDLIREWVGAGVSVFAFAPDYDADSLAKVRALGAEPIEYALSRVGMTPLADVRALARLWLDVRRLRLDATFTYFIKPLIYGNFAARLAGVRRRFSIVEGAGYVFIDEEHESWSRRLLRELVLRLYRLGLKGVERVFFLNREDLKQFVDHGLASPECCVMIGGIGVDLTHFSPAPVVERPVTFVLIARLLAEKGVREFVAVARALNRCAHFVLGGGPDANPSSVDRAELDAWSREGVVEWHDHVDDVRPLIARSSVLVLPSWYREGVPRSIQEAMAMGRPIITTDMPGCRDTVVVGENGFLVPPRDVEALIAAMRRFIDDPTLVARMGACSRQLAEQRFDVHRSNRLILSAMGLEQRTQPCGLAGRSGCAK